MQDKQLPGGCIGRDKGQMQDDQGWDTKEVLFLWLSGEYMGVYSIHAVYILLI